MPPTIDQVGAGGSSGPSRRESFVETNPLLRRSSSQTKAGLIRRDTTESKGSKAKQNALKKWDRDKMLSEDQKRFLQDFFHKEPCPYGHRVFKHASIIFGVLLHDLAETDPVVRRQKAEQAKQKLAELPPLEYESLTEQRLAFNLVFSALKYQKFIEDMLEDCAFFSQYPEFREDRPMVMVILCDLKLRKFQLRTVKPKEYIEPLLSEIEAALFSCKTKLNAALARSRIKACVLTVDHLLPETVRQNDKYASKMNVSIWINSIKTTMQAVIDEFQTDGFKMVDTDHKIKGKTFYLDHHCEDMLAFSGDMREYLEGHPLCLEGHFIIQDKSSCLGPQSVRNLINLGDDVMHVNIGSGLSTSHIASLTHGSDTVVYGFGVNHEKHYREVMEKIDLTGCKMRVKIMQENFLEVNLEDERFKHIKVVLVSADCSRSGVANPVDFIVSEAEDMGILKDLSLGQLDDQRLGEMVVKHNNILRHSMRFPRVQAVVYTTRSLHDAENENVVSRGIEYVNMMQQKKTPFRLAPPVLPLTDKDIEKDNPLNGKYLKFLPGPSMSGCFIATITREADDPKQAAKDILARAAARGIISGVPTVEKKGGKKNKGAKKNKAAVEKGAEKEKKKKEEKKSSKKSGKVSANRRSMRRSTARVVTLPALHTSSLLSSSAPAAAAAAASSGIKNQRWAAWYKAPSSPVTLHSKQLDLSTDVLSLSHTVMAPNYKLTYSSPSGSYKNNG